MLSFPALLENLANVTLLEFMTIAKMELVTDAHLV